MTPDAGGGALATSFYQACKGVAGGTASTGGSDQWNGACWNGTHFATLRFNAYTHMNTPNGLSCQDGGGQSPGDVTDAVTATSNHSGGVNVGMCDGSVRFIKDSVSNVTWWALGSRNLGEVVDNTTY